MTAAGQRIEQGRYSTAAGERGIYAQRIDGRVALTDAPIDHDGHVLLIERHVETNDELCAIVADYLQQSNAAGAPAARPNPAIVKALAAVAA